MTPNRRVECPLCGTVHFIRREAMRLDEKLASQRADDLDWIERHKEINDK